MFKKVWRWFLGLFSKPARVTNEIEKGKEQISKAVKVMLPAERRAKLKAYKGHARRAVRLRIRQERYAGRMGAGRRIMPPLWRQRHLTRVALRGKPCGSDGCYLCAHGPTMRALGVKT